MTHLNPRSARRARPRRLALPSVTATAAVLVAACGGDGSGAATEFAGTVDTLPNGAVYTGSPARGLWSPEERWRLEEELRIGSLEGEGPDVFGQVREVEVDDLGRLWVLEGQANELRVFGPDGEHVRTVGRQGGGPGEFQSPFGLMWGPDDDLWVVDLQNRRFEIFDTAGERVAGQPLRGTSFGMSARFDSLGRILDRENVPTEDGSEPAVIVRDPERGMAPVDTIDVPDRADAETVDVTRTFGSDAEVVMALPVPFVHQPGESLQHGGTWLAWPGGEAYRFVRLTLDGDTLQIVERDYEPVPIPAEVRREATSRDIAGGDVEFPENRIPEVYPPFDQISIAPDGHYWVRRTLGPDAVAFDVFAPDGRYLGEVETAVDLSRFRLNTLTDDALLGWIRDDLDVPYVVRLGIRKGADPGG